ncbi:MAG: 23S rRNA (pseudouridine(1915)-N(3))-methyltransferase RlmH [Bacteroidota bacterium]
MIWIGKSKQKAYQHLIDLYLKRLQHYAKVSIAELTELKQHGMPRDQFMAKEADLILSKIRTGDHIVLLDERGDQKTSVQLSSWLQQLMNRSTQRLVLIIGGAYGVHETLKIRSKETLSLSKMTLTHDMARVFILEQLYRAWTIIRGEKYHNE